MGRGAVWLGVVGGVVMVGLCVLWPLPGYIHPDEFFQSTEVVAGDIFNVSHLRTWEFNPDMPLRDITVPYLLYAPGFYCLHWLLTNHVASHTISESYVVLVIPRIVLALAGMINVCLILKLCAVFSVNRRVAVWLWVSAYTTWTFLLRSFSNTSETLLLSVVWLLLLETLPAYRGKLRSSGEKDSPPPRQAKEKESSLTNQRSAKVVLCHVLLGAVLCVGFFNRPTFVVFVAVPLLWWADLLCSSQQKTTVVFVLFLVGSGFLLTFVALSIGNSFYYNPDFRHLLEDIFTALWQWNGDTLVLSVQAVMAGLRIPPWSFVQYNMAAVNLAEHGLHPWYTHLLVHLPSLLGPWILLFYADLLRLLVRFRQRHGTDVLYAAAIIPVFCLSCFPHQEARFLLPILPLAVLCVAKHPLASWKSMQTLALVFNILGLVMFGILHQGGVVPALSSLQVRLKQESAQPSLTRSVRHHVISYSTYMLPRHLLFMNRSAVEVHVHDMIGAHNHPPALRLRVEKMASVCAEDSVRCRFWMLLPAPALADLEGWGVREEGEFCPHVSMERLPVGGGVRTWGEVRGIMPLLCLKVVSVTL